MAYLGWTSPLPYVPQCPASHPKPIPEAMCVQVCNSIVLVVIFSFNVVLPRLTIRCRLCMRWPNRYGGQARITDTTRYVWSVILIPLYPLSVMIRDYGGDPISTAERIVDLWWCLFMVACECQRLSVFHLFKRVPNLNTWKRIISCNSQ